jgi:hypothetical protein
MTRKISARCTAVSYRCSPKFDLSGPGAPVLGARGVLAVQHNPGGVSLHRIKVFPVRRYPQGYPKAPAGSPTTDSVPRLKKAVCGSSVFPSQSAQSSALEAHIVQRQFCSHPSQLAFHDNGDPCLPALKMYGSCACLPRPLWRVFHFRDCRKNTALSLCKIPLQSGGRDESCFGVSNRARQQLSDHNVGRYLCYKDE